MKDFRAELYNKYISTFKTFISIEDSNSIRSSQEIFKIRYLRLIQNYSKEASIIDIGCGAGHLLNFLKQSGYDNSYGIDISEQQVNSARSKGLNAEVVNIFDFIKTNKRKFDIIFAMDIVEHFYKDELFGFFSTVNNLLNDNGILIIRTPNGDGLFPNHIIYGDLTHLTIFNPNSLLQILRLTGFSKIEFYETGPTTKNFYGVVRLLLWKIIKIFIKSLRIIETGSAEKIITQDFICTAKK
jgi:2-polyprenyl-3-methyl-5-hydroxy-6-metoxy-1,4-benzoquinol methylase